MNTDPNLRAPELADTEGHVRMSDADGGEALRAPDTEGHVRYFLDELGNPEVPIRDDDEDTEGHVKF